MFPSECCWSSCTTFPSFSATTTTASATSSRPTASRLVSHEFTSQLLHYAVCYHVSTIDSKSFADAQPDPLGVPAEHAAAGPLHAQPQGRDAPGHLHRAANRRKLRRPHQARIQEGQLGHFCQDMIDLTPFRRN